MRCGSATTQDFSSHSIHSVIWIPQASSSKPPFRAYFSFSVVTFPNSLHLKNLPTILPASPLAIPLPLNALPAHPLAWLNLSHLENATVFVMVRTNAITITHNR